MICGLEKQPNVLPEKFDLLLIVKSKVLKNSKGYHAPESCGLLFGVFLYVSRLFYFPPRLSRDFLSSHSTSAKGLIFGGRCTKHKENQATSFSLGCFLKHCSNEQRFMCCKKCQCCEKGQLLCFPHKSASLIVSCDIALFIEAVLGYIRIYDVCLCIICVYMDIKTLV